MSGEVVACMWITCWAYGVGNNGRRVIDGEGEFLDQLKASFLRMILYSLECDLLSCNWPLLHFRQLNL
jgi:hypothetical protein